MVDCTPAGFANALANANARRMVYAAPRPVKLATNVSLVTSTSSQVVNCVRTCVPTSSAQVSARTRPNTDSGRQGQNYCLCVNLQLRRRLMLKVAVVGAGAAGLCCARYLGHHAERFTFSVFEKASKVGGTWLYTDSTDRDEYGLPVHSSMNADLR